MNLSNFKPLLAGTVTDIEKLKFPLIASPKLDGIRCIMLEGKALTRNLKPIPNKFIRETLEDIFKSEGYDVDGEIIIPGKDFNDIQSAVMSFEGTPDFVYMIFDTIESESYMLRVLVNYDMKYVKSLDYTYIQNLDFLIAVEETYVKQGYEGIMLRDPNGHYKFGRSTEKEAILLKLKRFHDAEAVIIGFEEKMTNNNEQTKDAMGYSIRSSEKAGMTPAGTLGALIVYDPNTLSEFKIGSGFSHAQLQEIWDNKEKYKDKLVTYKYQEISKYGIPRFPTFKSFRLEE